MHKNKNNPRGNGLVARTATILLLTTGVRITAHAADAELEQPKAAASAAVDVEVFKGVRILRTPGDNIYPSSEVRDGREGWVQLNMMIDPRGKPYEAMVIDSSGSPAFEKAAMKALNLISFEPARRGDTPIDSSFEFKMKFSMYGPAKGASRDFVSGYRRFTKAIDAGDKTEADAQLAGLQAQNLYEEAFENYGKYFYHRKWGTPQQQLTDLRLAIAGEKRPEYLPRAGFVTALTAIFALEVQASDLGRALDSWERLERLAPPATRTQLQPTVDQIRAIKLGNQAVRLPATIEKGNRWAGTLFRNRFSVAVKSGAVSEIKLRCEKQYLFFKYEPGLQYSIGSKDDRCGIEVVGDPGTSFDLIE
jgi:TonB family protein